MRHQANNGEGARGSSPAVAPIPPIAVTPADVGGVPRVEFSGCLVFVGIVMSGIVFSLFSEHRWWALLAAIGSGVTLVVAIEYLQYWSALNVYRVRLKDEADRRQGASEYEAKSLTNSLRAALKRFPEDLRHLAARYDGVQQTLVFARREFDERAYSSFWDAIVHAKSELDRCNMDVGRIANEVQHYGDRLKGRSHTFPLAPILPDSVPSMEATTRELALIARQGETDYHFASILEHKKTRSVLVAGFASIELAIGDLGAGLERNLNALRMEVAEGHRLQNAQSARLQIAVDEIAANTGASAAANREIFGRINRRSVGT